MYRPTLLLLCAAGVSLAQNDFSVSSGNEFQCVEDGFFVDSEYCDKYYDCYRGAKDTKWCPDGLVFDYTLGPKVEQCNYPFLVDCPQSKRLQDKKNRKSSVECPRENGYFEHEDASNCMDYYECTEGTFVRRTCPTGLVFDEFTGACVWETSGVRKGCSAPKPLVLDDGFHCNQTAQLAANGQQLIHTRFIDETDCRSFYVCQDGKYPTKIGCPEGTVFDDVSLECTDPSIVIGCECYYYPPNECPFENDGSVSNL